MKFEWKEVRLEDCVSVLGDGLHGTPKYCNDGEYFFINGNNLKNNKIVIKSDTKRIAKSEYDKYKKPLNDRTILVSINGTLGNIGTYNNEKVILGKSACYLNVIDTVDKNYIRYVLTDKHFQEYLNQYATGTTIKNISLKQMRDYTFMLPPLSKQKAISAILYCLDDKVELNNRINSILEQQTQAIVDNWFSSSLSANWSRGFLTDFVVLSPKRNLKKGDIATYVEMSNLPTSGSFPLGWEKKSYSGGTKFQNGDTLLARITPCLENGKTAYVNFLSDSETAFGSTEYIVMTAKSGYPNELIYFLARNKDFINFAVKNMAGTSGRQRVSADAIAKYELRIPPPEFVAEYTEVFKTVMNTTKRNSFENRTLTALRDTLLPKLMSGEIQVPLTNKEY